MQTDHKWSEIIELREKLWDLLYHYWVTETLFKLNWWILLLSAILLFISWIVLLDKKRVTEIILYGTFINLIGFILDVVGITMVKWSYPDRILPFISAIIEIHSLHMPIIFMLVYQYFHKWKSFIIAMTITSAVFSFVLEPFLIWLGIYEIYDWKFIYSFPIYILIAVVIKWLVLKLMYIEKSHQITNH